jgi:6-phosphogluconate dehydrogenase
MQQVAMRDMSKQLERIEFYQLISNAKQIDIDLPSRHRSTSKEACTLSILITYAQGLALLTKASKEYDYDPNLETHKICAVDVLFVL